MEIDYDPVFRLNYPALSPEVFTLLKQILQADTLQEILTNLSRLPFNHACEIIALRQVVMDNKQAPSLGSPTYWLKEQSELTPWPNITPVDEESLAKLWILSGGPPMFIEDIQQFALFTDASLEFRKKQGIVSLYHVLIHRQNTPIAVLSVKWRTSRTFSAEDKAIIEFTSWILAPMIQNIYLREENRELERLLRDLEQKLSESGTALHAIVHDLKQPLAAILSSAALLDRYVDKLNRDRIREKAQSINVMGLRMNDWISSILLLAQVRSDTETRFQSVNSKSALENALASIQALTQQFLPVIQVDTSMDNLPSIWGKSTWIEHIWANLLSNACKYGGNPPMIHISAHQQEESVRFSVKDNGPGIPQDKLEFIFQPFTRLYDDRQRSGTGIGLTIIKLLIDKQDGDVGVESDANGTTFWFTLPIAT